DMELVIILIDDHRGVVMIESGQMGEVVTYADRVFLFEITNMCNFLGLLLVIDEIQTLIGRTGKGFGYEHYGIEPDIFTLAKGLGNGLPVGAMVASKQLGETFGPGSHGSTFGGNPLAMSAAKAVLETMFNDEFFKEVEEKANYFAE